MIIFDEIVVSGTVLLPTVAPELCSRRVGAIEAISDLEE
jgi:hypothetical protein